MRLAKQNICDTLSVAGWAVLDEKRKGAKTLRSISFLRRFLSFRFDGVAVDERALCRRSADDAEGFSATIRFSDEFSR